MFLASGGSPVFGACASAGSGPTIAVSPAASALTWPLLIALSPGQFFVRQTCRLAYYHGFRDGAEGHPRVGPEDRLSGKLQLPSSKRLLDPFGRKRRVAQ